MAKACVTVRLCGGLGNQKFQYAAALGLAQRRGAEVVLDVSAFGPRYLRTYQLDRLQVPQRFNNRATMTGAVGWSVWSRIRRRLSGGARNANGLYVQLHFHFDERFLALSGDDILISGYFQSPAYFAMRYCVSNSNRRSRLGLWLRIGAAGSTGPSCRYRCMCGAGITSPIRGLRRCMPPSPTAIIHALSR